MNPERPLTSIVTRRPFTGISILVLLTAIIGGLYSLLNFPLSLASPVAIIALAVAVVGILMDRPRYHCGRCGHRTQRHSTFCPACQSDLVYRHRMSFFMTVTLSLTLFSGLLYACFWFANRPH